LRESGQGVDEIFQRRPRVVPVTNEQLDCHFSVNCSTSKRVVNYGPVPEFKGSLKSSLLLTIIQLCTTFCALNKIEDSWDQLTTKYACLRYFRGVDSEGEVIHDSNVDELVGRSNYTEHSVNIRSSSFWAELGWRTLKVIFF
jgi:hypothetical protein